VLDLRPPPRPCASQLRRVGRCAAEPDYPPTTCSGSPARQLVRVRLCNLRGAGAGRGELVANRPVTGDEGGRSEPGGR
jgi:hypothetical protein